jgi:hypothetical protein
MLADQISESNRIPLGSYSQPQQNNYSSRLDDVVADRDIFFLRTSTSLRHAQFRQSLYSIWIQYRQFPFSISGTRAPKKASWFPNQVHYMKESCHALVTPSINFGPLRPQFVQTVVGCAKASVTLSTIQSLINSKKILDILFNDIWWI